MENQFLTQEFKFKFKDEDDLLDYLENESLSNESHSPAFDWNYFSKHGLIGNVRLITAIQERTENSLNVRCLCANPNVVWDGNLIEYFGDQVDWAWLVCNRGLQITDWLLAKYEHHLIHIWEEDGIESEMFLQGLCENTTFPLDINLCNKYSHRIDWRSFGLNERISIIPMHDYQNDQSDIYFIRERIKFVVHFKKFWKYSRTLHPSTGDAGEIFEWDSIFDNREIDWTTPELRLHFQNEINAFNKKYSCCV